MKKKLFFSLDRGIGEILCVALIVIGGATVIITAVGFILAMLNYIIR